MGLLCRPFQTQTKPALSERIGDTCIQCAMRLGNPSRQHSPPVRGGFMRRFIAITAADAADDSAPLLTATADLTGGNSYALVAHLTADGSPTISPYANDISTISA